MVRIIDKLLDPGLDVEELKPGETGEKQLCGDHGSGRDREARES